MVFGQRVPDLGLFAAYKNRFSSKREGSVNESI